jgi:hypothetical protein
LEKLCLLAIAGAVLMIPALYALHIQQGKITAPFVFVHSLIGAFLVGLFWLASRRGAGGVVERGMKVACVAAVAGSFAFNLVTEQPQDRAITELIAPHVVLNEPTALSLIASNHKSYQYSTFRTGCYWHELDPEGTPDAILSAPGFTRVRAFILDADDLQKPEIGLWLAWLEQHTTEKTSALNAKLGKNTGMRVFVR